MEKYEIIKWLEIFDKRIKDIKEVLNIDQISSQIKLYEEQMLEEGLSLIHISEPTRRS